jgi:hypothetical protein
VSLKAVHYPVFSQIAPVEGFDDDPFEVSLYVIWAIFLNQCLRASALLDRLPNLGEVRRKLVPSRLSEEQFWAAFLVLVREEVLKTIDNS